MQGAPVCRKFLVSGRVQGVFFRDSTRREARRLGLQGYAVNLADGRVEVLACGERRALEALTRWLHQGPSGARVTDLRYEGVETDPVDGFSIG